MVEIVLRAEIEAKEPVETSLLRAMLWRVKSQVPFAMDGGIVAAFFESFWQESFRKRDGFGLVGLDHA